MGRKSPNHHPHFSLFLHPTPKPMVNHEQLNLYISGPKVILWSPLARVGSARLLTYKRIGRIYSLEILRKILEESEFAHKGKGED